MRLNRAALAPALLILAASCAPEGESAARRNTMLDGQTHDSFFPIAAGSKHALGSDSPAITCNSCHGGADTFKEFDCLSCHEHADHAALDQRHRGMSLYAYESASCY